MKFEDLLMELDSGKTFEEICKENGNCMVECIGNTVYEDDDLYEYLQESGADISDFGVGYAVIETTNGKVYEVPYEVRPNRFGDDLCDETVLFFESNRIYDVTKNYANQQYNCSEKQITSETIKKLINAYKDNADTLYKLDAIIDEYGRIDNGITDIYDTFEMGYHTALQDVFSILGIKEPF